MEDLSQRISKENTSHMGVHEKVLFVLETALLALEMEKPGDRSEVDRSYAVTITEMEKVIAYFDRYVVQGRG